MGIVDLEPSTVTRVMARLHVEPEWQDEGGGRLRGSTFVDARGISKTEPENVRKETRVRRGKRSEAAAGDIGRAMLGGLFGLSDGNDDGNDRRK